MTGPATCQDHLCFLGGSATVVSLFKDSVDLPILLIEIPHVSNDKKLDRASIDWLEETLAFF